MSGVAVISGGVGAARFLRGLIDAAERGLVPAHTEEIAAIVNTGDDLELQVGVGQRLDEIDYGMREWVGLAFYYLMGRTETFFPAP